MMRSAPPKHTTRHMGTQRHRLHRCIFHPPLLEMLFHQTAQDSGVPGDSGEPCWAGGGPSSLQAAERSLSPGATRDIRLGGRPGRRAAGAPSPGSAHLTAGRGAGDVAAELHSTARAGCGRAPRRRDQRASPDATSAGGCWALRRAGWKRSCASCRRTRPGASTKPSRRAAPGPWVSARGRPGTCAPARQRRRPRAQGWLERPQCQGARPRGAGWRKAPS